MLLGVKEYTESEVKGEHKAAEKSLHMHQHFLRLQTFLLFKMKNYCSPVLLVNGSLIYYQKLTYM